MRVVSIVALAFLIVQQNALAHVLEKGRKLNRWNLQDIFANTPTGSYMNFMKPLLYANYLTYRTSLGPRRDPFIDPITATITEEYSGGYNWTRLYDVEEDPLQGPHMRAFVDHHARRAILAFRGTCFDELLPGCRADMHMGEDGNPSEEDYFENATARVNKTKEYLAKISSDYAVLVTGHSLGAKLASEACARSGDCQVVVLAGGTATNKLNLVKDHFLLFDPTDLGIPPSLRAHKTIGSSTLCVYDISPPQSCIDCAAQKPKGMEITLAGALASVETFLAIQECRLNETAPFGHYKPLCWDDTHWLDHWKLDILPRTNADNSPFLPNCTVYSESHSSGIPMSSR